MVTRVEPFAACPLSTSAKPRPLQGRGSADESLFPGGRRFTSSFPVLCKSSSHVRLPSAPPRCNCPMCDEAMSGGNTCLHMNVSRCCILFSHPRPQLPFSPPGLSMLLPGLIWFFCPRVLCGAEQFQEVMRMSIRKGSRTVWDCHGRKLTWQALLSPCICF